MNNQVLHLDDKNFKQEVLDEKGVVMVDFSAAWCGPCKMIAPVVSQLADEYTGKAKVAKLDVDEAGATAMQYRVMGVPTIIFFKDGKEITRIVGARPKADFQRNLDSIIG